MGRQLALISDYTVKTGEVNDGYKITYSEHFPSSYNFDLSLLFFATLFAQPTFLDPAR
jgi:hypothetical protein